MSNIFPMPSSSNITPRNVSSSDIFNNILEHLYISVPICPSREQINHATRSILFRDIVAPLSSSCPITLERFENDSMVRQIIHCGHIFQPSSLESWFQTNARCPICRYDIRTNS